MSNLVTDENNCNFSYFWTACAKKKLGEILYNFISKALFVLISYVNESSAENRWGE